MNISLYNRQRKVRLALPRLQRVAKAAFSAVLPPLAEVEVTFISDTVIARVHRDFMGIPGATDVITFGHGEILISAETARENALKYGRPLEEELARYIVHGLLHLKGYEDKTPAKRKQMHRVQEKMVTLITQSQTPG